MAAQGFTPMNETDLDKAIIVAKGKTILSEEMVIRVCEQTKGVRTPPRPRPSPARRAPGDRPYPPPFPRSSNWRATCAESRRRRSW